MHQPRRLSWFTLTLAAVVAAVALGGCVSSAHYIPGTKFPDNETNRDILRTLEKYRTAMEANDAPALLAMASPNYWEDGGTPTGKDDYGYDQLREVLVGRFPRASSIRYSLKYMSIHRERNRAAVQVMIDASFTLQTARGPQRYDQKDQNELVLEHDGQRWLFVSGM